jgi:hypothetical protein
MQASKTMKQLSLFALVTLLFVQFAQAQDSSIVPDVTGLTVPVAAAELNRVGIAIGQEIGEPWSLESGLIRNAVAEQSIAPGTAVEPGTRIDLTVMRSPNITLIYDDNDLTLVNQAGSAIDLTGIFFQALDGNQATFAASRWGRELRENRCAQSWSVNRNGPKGLDECDYIEHWLTTNNGAEHFWTGAGGTTQFSVTQGGIERAVCPVANPGRCEFYLPAASTGDMTEYVYFAYTSDRLAIINNSEDKWMSLADLDLINNYAEPAGTTVAPANPTLYGSTRNPAANLNRLAPGQCIFFTDSSPAAQTPPQPCDVVARLDVGPSVIFWGAEFPVDSVSDDQPHSCPVAQPERLILCILPR